MHLLRLFVLSMVAGSGWLSLALAQAPEASKANSDKPRVLILGDSISIGYTPFVQQMLKDEAVVIRPMRNAKDAENCSGTENGVKKIDTWLKIDGGNWDLIHLNFGLHDLKKVDPTTGAASKDPSHPRQSEPDKYEENLRKIVARLKKTGAKLSYATTTPVPDGSKNPHRAVEDAVTYNAIAVKVMKENDVTINDLYEFALPRLKEIQRPANVHFTDRGSKQLAQQVADHIRRRLEEASSK